MHACTCVYTHLFIHTQNENVKYKYINYMNLCMEWIWTFTYRYILNFHQTVYFEKENWLKGRSSWVLLTLTACVLKIVGSFSNISIIVRPRNHSQDQQQANITTQQGFYPPGKVFIEPRPVVVWHEFDNPQPSTTILISAGSWRTVQPNIFTG